MDQGLKSMTKPITETERQIEQDFEDEVKHCETMQLISRQMKEAQRFKRKLESSVQRRRRRRDERSEESSAVCCYAYFALFAKIV